MDCHLCKRSNVRVVEITSITDTDIGAFYVCSECLVKILIKMDSSNKKNWRDEML
jgi:protein-arginine kinase activator protein McsA